MRIDLHERLKRSARMHFDSLSRLEQKHCFCAAKTFARSDRANGTTCLVVRLYQKTPKSNTNALQKMNRILNKKQQKRKYARV
ncbi:hypothetical protein CJ214_02515 [Peptoniphilus lacrimalis]|nr:hypothetical protein CJ214_02515 [Peptoniphilus lacrimalis]